MRRLALWMLVALLAIGGVVALGLLARERARRDATVYTDGRSIAVPARDAPLRTILWTPPEPLPGGVNTAGDDHQPRVSLDGSTLFFVRGRAGGGADIWWARRDADTWADPAPIDAINTPFDELTPCPTPSGDALVFASDRPAGKGGYDLWIARRDGDAWSAPVWLGEHVNTPHNDYAPSVSPDGLWLWYASNRPDKAIVQDATRDDSIDPFAPPPAASDYDIYRARLAGDAASLVTRIKELCSDADDVTPAWSPQGDFIYFASDRARADSTDHGFDLYRARIADAVPLPPEPLGPTINTPRDELDPGVALGGFELLFSIALPADAADDSPDLDLARSMSREVYPVVDRSRMRLDLPHLWNLFGPWLLSLLLLLLLLLLLVKFRSSQAAQGRWRRLSLLARCLLLSLLIHALLLALLGLWRVSSGIGDLLEDDEGMRIRLTSSRTGVATQLSGAFVQTPTELATSEATARAAAEPVASPTTMLNAAAAPADSSPDRAQTRLTSNASPEPVTTPEATELAAAQPESTLSTPTTSRMARMSEATTPQRLASAATPARARPAPAGAASESATIEPGASHTAGVAMTQPAAADATPATAITSAEPPSSAPTPTTTPRTEEGDRVAATEQRAATPLAQSTTTPAPSGAIEAPPLAPGVASEQPAAADLAPRPAPPDALVSSGSAPTDNPPTQREVSGADAPHLASTETARAERTTEPDARTPTATQPSTSARIESVPGGSDAAPALARTGAARAELHARPMQTPALAAHAPSAASDTIDASTPAQLASAGETRAPATQRPDAASDPEPIPSNPIAQARGARSPDTGASEAPETDQFAYLAPDDDGAPAPLAAPTTTPGEADSPADLPTIAQDTGQAPTPAAVTLPTDRGQADDPVTSDLLASGAPSVSNTPSVAAPLMSAASHPAPERIAPAAAAIAPQQGDFSLAEQPSSDSPQPLSSPVNLSDAAPALTSALPEAPPLASDTPPPSGSATNTLALEAPRMGIDSGSSPPTTPLGRLDPEPSQHDLAVESGVLADSHDAAAPPSLSLALPLADHAGALPTPGAAHAAQDNAPSDTHTHTGDHAPLAPQRAALADASSPALELAHLDTAPGSTRGAPIPAAALDDADAPSESIAVALDLSPRAARGPDVPPMPAEPEVYPQRDELVRQELVERGGGSQETEKAVADALAWLARNQSPDGRWSSQGFQRVGGASGDPARYDFDVATTGLALLCFLGADHTPLEDGPYQDNVARALAWLLARESMPGEFRASESMYSQAIATIALCESYAMTRDPRLVAPVQRAVNFIIGARNDIVGGWRYEPGQPGDTSVLGWMVMSFESARRCGIDIDPAAPATAHEWLDHVMDPDWPGRYAYRPGMESTRSMTAEGMFVQQLLKIDRDDPRQLGAARYVLQDLPRWNDDAPTYQWYYATLALFQHGGGAWDRWNRSMSHELVEAQRDEGPAAGSWDPTDRYAQIGGRIYQTAICTLTLEVYYRYLPMYVDEPVAGMGGE